MKRFLLPLQVLIGYVVVVFYCIAMGIATFILLPIMWFGGEETREEWIAFVGSLSPTLPFDDKESLT